MINNKTILITGGTGSFGRCFINYILKHYKPKKIIVYSRDELKQFNMQNELKAHSKIIRYFIGDVRDKERLNRAFNGVDIVVHAAALKQVPAIEYNPIEALNTNVIGAKNIIEAAIDNKVKKIVALSTDKACLPINFYGGTKFLSDKLFQAGNVYSKDHGIQISIVRYGNVAGSRGSIIPLYKELKEKGEKYLPVTHPQMTRFWIDLDDAVKLVIKAIKQGKGGEIFISKIKSFYITDLVKAFGCKPSIIGIRPGEKLSESMIVDTDICYEYDDHFRLYPTYEWYNIKKHLGPKCKLLLHADYNSTRCNNFMTVQEIKEKLCIS